MAIYINVGSLFLVPEPDLAETILQVIGILIFEKSCKF